MILALQASPLILLVALLLSGRAGPVPAVLAALALSIPAALASLPASTDALNFISTEMLRGAWLALQPVGVMTGGLLFHAAIAAPVSTTTTAPEPRRIFAACLLMGTFMESVTGFAVGAVFALAALKSMGLRGPVAGAMALLSLCLVPWGGLGPGTLLGATLVGVPVQAMARVIAFPNAAWLLMLGPVLWHLCAKAGIAVSTREKLSQTGILAASATILIGGHWILPFEILGILATGLPLLAVLYRLDPPRTPAARADALRALTPYLILTAALLAARLIPDAPALRPYETLPAFPITHVAVVLWTVSLVLLALRSGMARRIHETALRARKPAAALLLYVLLARILAGSGATTSLAEAAASALGPLAPFAITPLGLAAGLVTGSNVGANAALVTVQAALGAHANLPPLLAPALHNFAGGAGAGMSFAVCALICGLLADGTKPAQLWRLLLPSFAAILAVGTGAVLVLR
jgi:lactate permease